MFTAAQCGAWQVVQGVLLQVIVTTVDVILITRGELQFVREDLIPVLTQFIVYALYGRNRIILGIVGPLFVGEIAFLCYVLADVTPRLKYDDECFVTSSPSIFQYYWYVLSFKQSWMQVS